MSKEKVSFEDTRCISETTDALLCEVDGKEVWFPKSTIHEDSEITEDGNEGTLVVQEWIAIEKGLV